MLDHGMKVCQVLLTMEQGGAEVLAARLARRLSDEFRIVFACLDRVGPLGEQLREDGFEVHVLDRRPGIDWRCSRRLRTLIRRERVEVVHAHQYAPFFYTAVARWPRSGPPIVFTEHGRDHPDLPSRSHAVTNGLLLRRHDRVFGVGRDVRRALIENEGFPAGSVGVVHNGIDLSAFEVDHGDREAIRREIGLEPDDFVIAQVAHLDPLKDHATGLRSLAHLAKDRGDVRLVLIGDGPEAGRIRQLVESLGLEPFVRMLGRRSDVPRLLRAVNLSLLTSVSEGIPLALIESMAAGLPLVATRVGGVPEVVQDGETGLLVPAGDDLALARAISRLAGSQSLRATMGDQGRRTARADFSEDRMVEAYRQAYRGTGDRSARGAAHRAPTARAVYFPGSERPVEDRDELERKFFRMIRQKNGTHKYTRSNRLDDLNELVAALLPSDRPLRIMDVAVSSGISTIEWSESLDRAGVAHSMTAGDLNIQSHLVSIGRRLHVLADGSGYPLQFDINGVAVPNPPARRWLALYLPLILLMKGALRLVFRPRPVPTTGDAGHWIMSRPVTLVSPRLLAHPKIELIEDDIVANGSLRDQFHVVRAANILNPSYFDEPTLVRIVTNLRDRLMASGLLVICTLTEEVEGDIHSGMRNDGTVFALCAGGGLEVVGRIGAGSAIENLLLGLSGGEDENDRKMVGQACVRGHAEQDE